MTIAEGAPMNILVFWGIVLTWAALEWRKHLQWKADQRLALHARRIAYKHADYPESVGRRVE